MKGYFEQIPGKLSSFFRKYLFFNIPFVAGKKYNVSWG